MKTLTLTLLCLTLAACGSEDKKPAVAAAKPVLAAVEGQKEGVVCPTINGKFGPKESNGEDLVTFTTKVEDGLFSYKLADDMPLVKADGKPVRIEGKDASESGSLLATCDAESVTFMVQVDNQPAPIKVRYVPVGQELRAELKSADGQDVNIMYVRK